MGLKIPIAPQKFKRVPSGIYKATLRSYETGKGVAGQNIVILRFEIIDEKYAGFFVNGIVNQSSNGKYGKLWQVHKALANDSLDVFDQFEPDALIGKTCFINVEERGKNNAITEYIPLADLTDVERSNSET